MKIVSQNRSASHDYHLLEKFEAGIVLQGSEVKSIRSGHISLKQAFVVQKGSELFLHNAHITTYSSSKDKNHDMRADRKLLLHAREIRKLIGCITRKGMTLVPLKMYLNDKGILKLQISLATGMKKQDKRQTLKEREWKRNAQKVLKQHHQKEKE